MSRRGSLDASEIDIQQGSPVDIPADGSVSFAEPAIEPVEGPSAKHKGDKLAFMEELVEIMVHESTDKNAEPIVLVGVNGRNQFFARGQVQRVRRKFIEALARCKPIAYSQSRQYDPRSGNTSMRMDPHRALRYPFSIVSDPNPKGADWLKAILNER
jgi:hypothetical protein